MRITQQQLRRIIREEVQRSLSRRRLEEGFFDDLKGVFGKKDSAPPRQPMKRGIDSGEAMKGNIEQLQYAIDKGNLKAILTQAQALAEALMNDSAGLKAKLGKKYTDQVEKGMMGPLKNLLGRINDHLNNVPQDIQEMIKKVETKLPELQRMMSAPGSTKKGD